MGEMAEYYAEQQLCDEFSKPQVEPDENHWVTRDFRRIAVVDMEDTHLYNTIRMVRRNVEMYKAQETLEMGRYMENAPDGAYDACALEQRQLEEMDREEYLHRRIKPYKRMLAEAERRKIDVSEWPPEEEIQKVQLLWFKSVFGEPKELFEELTQKSMSNKSKSSIGQTDKSTNSPSSSSSSQSPTQEQEPKADKPGR